MLCYSLSLSLLVQLPCLLLLAPVVNSWQTHTPGVESVHGRDFVRLNRKAVVRGAVSSKDIAAYRSTHDARLRGARATILEAPDMVHDPAFVFGRPSKPSTPIHDVLTNTFQRNAILESTRHQAFVHAMKVKEEGAKTGKFGQSQHTRASLGHMKIRAPPAREPFKMEKFKEVGPRIGYQGLTTRPHQHQGIGEQREAQQQAYDRYQQEADQRQYDEQTHGADQQQYASAAGGGGGGQQQQGQYQQQYEEEKSQYGY
jgi:hypothetical protein